MLRTAFCILFLSSCLVAQSDDLPEDKGKETFVRMCSNCHALKRVTKARFSKKFWESTVDDMVSRGAEGTEEEANIVVVYLTRNFGKPVNVNAATAKEMQLGLSFTAAESEQIVKYRTEHGELKSLEDVRQIPGLNPGRLDEQKKNIAFTTPKPEAR